jgi:Ca-activated chloride channel homolog
MDQKIASESAVFVRRSAVRAHLADGLSVDRCILPVSTLVLILTIASNLWAESLASKNKEGNRLFAQGKYEDAEKAYLDAQVKNPGKPEVLYNLGNSLIKQNKYSQGIQSLLQSEDKGDKAIKENSWYNTGNALFSMGKYKESAEAFIQALKINSADSDAKHNLELALMKLKQQQQKQSDSNQRQQNSKNSNKDLSAPGKGDRQQQPMPKNQNESGGRKDQNNQAKQPTAPEVQRQGSISKEQAAQMLDAVRNQELEQQRKLLESRASQRANGKDW